MREVSPFMLRFITLSLLVAAALSAPCPIRLPAATTMTVEIEKRGRVVIELHMKEAPKTCAQIMKLAGSDFYAGQKFHKVIKEPRPYLIQTGDPQSKTKAMDDPDLGTGGSGTTVDYEESGFANIEGAVGLSTKPRDKNSGDSQFYILLAPAKFLDGNYTVFGQVTQGMDIVKQVQLGDRVTSVTIQRG